MTESLYMFIILLLECICSVEVKNQYRYIVYDSGVMEKKVRSLNTNFH